MSGYHFQTTTAYVDQRQDPNAVPVLDYHRTFAIDPDHSNGIGGEATVELNAANINRTEALYQSVGIQQFDNAYGVYSTCTNYKPGTDAERLPAQRHRGRLRARHGAVFMAAQDRRSDRRGLDAVRVRPRHRRVDRAEHQRELHLFVE